MSNLSAKAHIITRISKLMARVVGCFLFGLSTATAADWISRTPLNSTDADLCEALLHRLNHTPPPCIQVAIGSYQGFKSPPWKKIDIYRHLGLVDQLMSFNGWTRPRVFGWDIPVLKQSLQAEGAILQIWQTRLLTYFDENSKHPTSSSNQTVAFLSKKIDSASLADCPAYASLQQGQNFEVSHSLSAPDLRVAMENASLLMHSNLVYMKERSCLSVNKWGTSTKNIPDSIMALKL